MIFDLIQNYHRRVERVAINSSTDIWDAWLSVGGDSVDFSSDKIDEIINKRKKIGKLFLDASDKVVDWFIPQKTPKNCIHAYYTFSARYLLNENNYNCKVFLKNKKFEIIYEQ